MAKKLLNENTIRRFMKLADIEPLTETFVDQYDTEIKEELEDLPAEEGPMGDEPVEELPEEPLEEPEGEEKEVSITDEEAEVLVGLGRKLEGEVEGELPEEPLGEPEPELDLGAEGDLEDLEGEEEPGLRYENLVKTIASRVAERLVNESKKKKKKTNLLKKIDINKLTDRVAERLIKEAKK